MAGPGPTMIGGRYQLLSKLGTGGMAEVWLAADRRLNDKHVAVKRLHGFRLGGEESAVDLERARREAFAVSRLSHPNLVAVTDFIAEHGEPFIVMEYVAGRTLDDLTGPDGMPVQDAARVLAQVAAALAEAHAAQIVHRDIKPANIMVTPRGDAKLADFGIARSPDDPRFTRTGSFTGTIRYLAPEILEGGDATPASDMWSLGATLFEAVEGQPAFDAPTMLALMAAIAMKPLPTLHRAPVLAPLIGRLLTRDPASRPTAAEVAAQLHALAVTRPDQYFGPPVPVAPVAPADPTVHGVGGVPFSGPVGAPAPPTRARVRPKRRSPRWVLVAVPIALVVAGVGVVAGVTSGDRPVASDGGVGATPRSSSNSTSGAFATPSSASNTASSASSTAGSASSTAPLTGSTTGATVVFGGVTVGRAFDLTRPPQVRSRSTVDPSTLGDDDLVVGRGRAAAPASTVTVRYVGVRYRDGTVVDSSWTRRPTTASFMLTQVIPGFARGIGGTSTIDPMRTGGRRIVVIPADLAYGSAGTGAIPPDTPLVYVVDLIGVS